MEFAMTLFCDFPVRRYIGKRKVGHRGENTGERKRIYGTMTAVAHQGKYQEVTCEVCGL